MALSHFDLTRMRGWVGPRTALSPFDLTYTRMRHFDLALPPFDLTRVRGSVGPRTAMSAFDLTRTRMSPDGPVAFRSDAHTHATF